MNRLIFIIVLSLPLRVFSLDSPGTCSPKMASIVGSSALKLIKSTEQISCIAKRSEYQCEELEKNSPEDKDKIIQCDQKSIENNSITKINLFSCVFSGIKMSGEQLIELAKLPATIAQGALKSFKEEQQCSKDLDRKREMLQAFNLSISDSRFTLEESFFGSRFESISCAEIERLLHARYENYNQQIYREMIAAKNAGKPYKTPEAYQEKHSELLKNINEVMKMAKIHYECYTPKIKAELVCKTLASLATDMAMGTGLAKAAESLKKIVSSKNALATTQSIQLTKESVEANNEAKAFAFRPEWARSSKMSGEFRQILRQWKPGSSKANSLAEMVAYKQMKELGMKKYSFTITEDSLPESSRFAETALKHPQMPEYIKKINEAGFELKINPHMAVESDYGATLGRFNPPAKAVEILPNTTWEVFQHEYQHLVFWKLGLRNHTFVADSLVPAEQKIIERARKLYNKGFSRLTVDETMAVEAEIKELYKLGYTPWSGPVYEARKYAWGFQEKDIEKGLLGKSEAAKIFFKKVALNPYIVRSALGISATSAMYLNFHKGEVIVLDENGKAQKYKVEEINLKENEKKS